MNEPLPYTDWYTEPQHYEDWIPISMHKKEKICKLCNTVVNSLSSHKICNDCTNKRREIRRIKAKVRATSGEYKPMSNIKLEMLSLLGKKCSHCGYDQYLSALEFHHINPMQKEYLVSALINRYNVTPNESNYKLLLNEVNKCILLCGNCHSAKHAGEW